MSDEKNPAGDANAQETELSDAQLESVAGGGILDDLKAAEAWAEEQLKKKLQALVDLANGGGPAAQ